MDKYILPGTDQPEVDFWNILVLAIVKQGLNCDDNRLQNLANSHDELRQFLGHGDKG